MCRGLSEHATALRPERALTLPTHAALKRKGKGDDVTEDDMDGFIAAHNGK